MTRPHGPARFGVLALLGTLLTVAAWGDEAHLASSAEVATVVWDSNSVTFRPHVAGAALTLSVGCGSSFHLAQELPGASEASFVALNEDGSPLPDGRCTYELRIHPEIDATLVETVEASGDDRLREELARLEAERTAIVSGGFEIVGGAILKPDVAPDAETPASHWEDHSH